MYVDRHTITNTSAVLSSQLSLIGLVKLILPFKILNSESSLVETLSAAIGSNQRATHSSMPSTFNPNYGWNQMQNTQSEKKRKEQSTAILSFPTPVNYHIYGLLCLL